MSDKFIIRPEKPEDYHDTELMTHRAFWNRYGRGCCEHLLVHKLRDDPKYLPELSRVAEIDGKIVGLILYSECSLVSEKGEFPVLTFGPLCVDPAYQSTGIGGALLRETIALAEKTDYPGIVIFGEPYYYPRHGFKTCDHFGITDMEGHNSNAFMGYELHPGALSAIGGWYRELEVFADDSGLEEFNKNFPSLPPITLPLQWGYDTADETEVGYTLIEGRFERALYQKIFDEYVEELGRYLPRLLQYPLSEDGHRLVDEVKSSFASSSKRQYIIKCGGRPAGLAVFSGPDPEDEPDGCTHYIEEFYVMPEFQNKGIGSDLALRYLRQNEDGACGICDIKNNKKAVQFWENIAKRGGYSYTRSDWGEYWWYVLSKGENNV